MDLFLRGERGSNNIISISDLDIKFPGKNLLTKPLFPDFFDYCIYNIKVYNPDFCDYCIYSIKVHGLTFKLSVLRHIFNCFNNSFW